jgi:hypothetical protein
MPYKDWAKQREYQRQYKRRQRAEVFKDQRCARCGATENLELHHINPEEKEDHRIWSWSRERIHKELAKCESSVGTATARRMAALTVAALAMRDWKQDEPVDRLFELLELHAGGDEVLVLHAALMIIACMSAAP